MSRSLLQNLGRYPANVTQTYKDPFRCNPQILFFLLLIALKHHPNQHLFVEALHLQCGAGQEELRDSCGRSIWCCGAQWIQWIAQVLLLGRCGIILGMSCVWNIKIHTLSLQSHLVPVFSPSYPVLFTLGLAKNSPKNTRSSSPNPSGGGKCGRFLTAGILQWGNSVVMGFPNDIAATTSPKDRNVVL